MFLKESIGRSIGSKVIMKIDEEIRGEKSQYAFNRAVAKVF